jgi:hypothetical protein
MWAVWSQLTDTAIARLYHEDLQHLKRIGLDGLISCQSFRVFYPSGLAMAVLAKSLWNPDVPWEKMRHGYLEAAYGEYADFADEYLDVLESFLDTGDPHRRTPPLSNAGEEKLAACAEFLEASLAEMALHRETISDRVRDRSLDLLAHHAHFLQFIVRAYQARLAGRLEQANQEFDRAAELLCQTEPQYSPYIDTMLALRSVEEAKQME